MFAFLRSRPSVDPALFDPIGFDPSGPDAAGLDATLLETFADVREAALAEAEASFTPDRAAAQRMTILARLGASEDPRVLSFPPRALDAPAPLRRTARPRPALGWMLTAAAAGLIVGLGTGQGLYDDWQPGGQATPQARTISVPVAEMPAGLESDDAFLRDVEVALAERGVDELQPLDALTPRVTLVASR
jgi:hypothetical protein